MGEENGTAELLEEEEPEEDDRLSRLRAKARQLPLQPGVYLMKDSTGKIIYIGKAKALKNRVTQYFGSHQERHLEKVRQMVARVADFETIICDSEYEALVLECSLIKQNQPKYNILLKDDKGFRYIRVTPPPWTRIDEAKAIADDGAQYLGPYNSNFVVSQSVDEALKAFKLPQCGKVFPRDIGKERPCLNYFIGLCAAPCAGKITEAAYAEAANGALLFLKGGSAAAVERMTAQMEAAAERLDFEEAARLRDRISAVKKLSERQKVMMSKVPEQDVIASAKGAQNTCFEVFRFEAGRLTDQESFFVDTPEDEAEARYEFLLQYYSMRQRIPPQITLDFAPADEDLLLDWLSRKAGRRVYVHVPQKGEQLQLVTMCRQNAAERVAQRAGRALRETAALDELARLLGCPRPPEYIEAYDISHTAGTENVAGMVVFSGGRPLKSAYRKFKIQSVSGQDDYASLRETLTRRFNEYESHKDTGEGFGRLPDLILVDGGRGQVSAVLPVVREFGLQIPVFGMVKDDKHRTRAVTSEGEEIAIKATRSVYTLVSSIQEEVHRFAIGYHRQRRQASISSALTQIEGIGEQRAKLLLKAFRTVKAVEEASVEDLCAVKGMSRPAAKRVYEYFHAKTGENAKY